MDPNYPMKTINPNSEKVWVSRSEGLSYTVLVWSGLQLSYMKNCMFDENLDKKMPRKVLAENAVICS